MVLETKLTVLLNLLRIHGPRPKVIAPDNEYLDICRLLHSFKVRAATREI